LDAAKSTRDGAFAGELRQLAVLADRQLSTISSAITSIAGNNETPLPRCRLIPRMPRL